MQQRRPARAAGARADAGAGLVAVAVVAVAAAAGWWLIRTGVPILSASPPLFATWGPHVGPGTPAALLVAAAVVGYGPRLAARLRWDWLLLGGYAAALAWIVSLALVDGGTGGLTTRLTGDAEYLPEVAGVHDVPAMLHGFAGRILDHQPASWNTQVAGHPPAALLVFVWLDRIGLGGAGWAAAACVAAGGLAAVAVPATLRALGDEPAARAAAPFLVLFPGAVWLGVSADAIFAGATATGIALLAVGGRRGGPAGVLSVLAGGLLLGLGLFLSYGMVLMAAPALAAVLVLRRAWPLPVAAAGAAAVAAAFAHAGFWWYDGYRLVVRRYYQGIAEQRPYAYWVGANLAALVLSAGPAMAAALRRAVTAALGRPAGAEPLRPAAVAPAPPEGAGRLRRAAGRALTGPVALPLAAGLAIAAADLSGLSKAEVERIWLPFAVWLLAGAALLPAGHRRWWLAAQAATALAVNHLVRTVW